MDFELSDNQKMIREMIADFAIKEIAPFSANWDKNRTFPRDIFGKLGELGIMGMLIPEKYGGSGLDALTICIMLEELARADASIGLAAAVHNALCLPLINLAGTTAQKEKYLPDLTKGKIIGTATCPDFPGNGQITPLKIEAVKKSDRLVLNGSARFLVMGAVADILLVFAMTNQKQSYETASVFIVERGVKGLKTPITEKSLGLNACALSELVLDNVEIPKENILGVDYPALEFLGQAIETYYSSCGAVAIGSGRAALEEGIKYALQREQFGQIIGKFQAIQWMITDMATNLDAARLSVWDTAINENNKDRFPSNVRIARCNAAKVAQESGSKALQIHGGYGYIKDFPVERYFRDSAMLAKVIF
jgi:alkylation response protein AidB-like acyl-CoA dehydrogenase